MQHRGKGTQFQDVLKRFVLPVVKFCFKRKPHKPKKPGKENPRPVY